MINFLNGIKATLLGWRMFNNSPGIMIENENQSFLFIGLCMDLKRFV